MTKTMKNSLISSVTLIIVAIVSVGVLMLANVFMPKYEVKLDLAKVTELNTILPTGVDDQTAYDEAYFEVADINIEDYNTESKNSANNKVLAAYVAVKGDNAGAVFVVTTAIGYKPGMEIMTVLLDGVIKDAILITTADTVGYFPDFEEIKKLVIGQNVVTASTLESVASGATNNSRNGLVRNFTMAIKLYNQLLGEGA